MRDSPPTDPDAGPRGERPSGAARGVALAALGLLATSTLVERLVAPVVPVITRKVERFAAAGDDYTMVFVGTSLVHHAFSPAGFARETGRLGHEERAFNFGVSHLGIEEALRIEERILALRPGRLRVFVFDLELFEDGGEAAPGTARDTWWRTPSATYRRLGADLSGEHGLPSALARAGADVAGFVRHGLAVGRLSAAFRARWDPRFQRTWDEVEDDDDGFFPYDAVPGAYDTDRRADFLAHKDAFEATVAARKRAPAPVRPLGAHARAGFEALAARAEAAGYRAVFAQMPDLEGSVRLDDGHRRPPVVLSFNDPGAYPDLFDVLSRFDAGHASARGAMQFTKHFARAFTDALHGAAGPAPGGAPPP